MVKTGFFEELCTILELLSCDIKHFETLYDVFADAETILFYMFKEKGAFVVINI